jgi:hypothetical protein
MNNFERDVANTMLEKADERIRELESLIYSMIIACDENMPAKASWLARRNGFTKETKGEQDGL